MNKRKIIVIGSGFAGLSASAYLQQAGYEVTVFEKNDSAGGRARVFKEQGYSFDMGPSWYWMPDVFEKFFGDFGKKPADYYQLDRLDPSYKVVFQDGSDIDVPADFEALCALFESKEKGAGQRLVDFMKEAEYKYQVGIQDLVYKPGRSLFEFASLSLIRDVLKCDVFTSMRKHVAKYFTHPHLVELIEFPVLFLGATPQDTPALYSLMSYADAKLGTWYPQGGMHKVIDGMVSVAKELGVKFEFEQEVSGFRYSDNAITHVITKNGEYATDIVVAGADYEHIEQHVLAPKFRRYNEQYWDGRTMAPSCLIYYLGVNKKIDGIKHHTLFFDTSFDEHSKEIYDTKVWPKNPLFYASAPSVTDQTVVPEGKENLFVLIPIATGIEDSEEMRDKYYPMVMKRLEDFYGTDIRSHVEYKRSYCLKDFKEDYHAFKGNAYGLANTLMQTAILKPSLKQKNLDNLYYTGQLTVPGPGVPPSLISGNVVKEEVVKEFPAS